jgi:hypothetical protein
MRTSCTHYSSIVKPHLQFVQGASLLYLKQKNLAQGYVKIKKIYYCG